MKKKNLIVFDIDDTITKSEVQHVSAYTDAMRHFGITNINQDWNNYLHHTDSYILKENYDTNLPDDFDFSFIEQFEVKMAEYMRALPPTEAINGAHEMMDFIVNHSDYAVCFATGSLLEPALMKLKQANISFDKAVVVGSNAIYEREGIVQAAIDKAKEHYQMEHFEHIISIGDGIWDLTTAKNLGVHFIGIGQKNYADFAAADIQAHIVDWMEFDLKNLEEKLGIDFR